MTSLTRREVIAASGAALAASTAQAAPRPDWRDATDLAGRIRKGELSAAEAVQAAVRAAEATNPELNFLVTPDFERALEKAARGRAEGPFGGVPFLIKDQASYIGLPTRAGSRSRRDSPPLTRQSPYVDAFDRAGLVVIGKSATPEFGFLPTTEPLAGGPTRNPWDPSRSSGGSSGGAAAAVAAGVVPVAHGSDGGGSLRIPGAACGLFALKPSRGRMLGARNERQVTDIGVNHVLSRSVRDSAALFALTEDTGPDAQHPAMGLIIEPVRGRLRIGAVLEGPGGKFPDPEIQAAHARTLGLLKDLGHEVVPTRWPIDERFNKDFTVLWGSGAAAVTAQAAKAAPGTDLSTLFEPFTLALAERAAKTTPEGFAQAMAGLQRASAAYGDWFRTERLDVILSPVTAEPPPKLGVLAGSNPFDVLEQRLLAYAGYTPLHNVAGAPAMSVPLHMSRGGLPIGAQFAAPVGGEKVLFQLAYQLEAAEPWIGRHPRRRPAGRRS